MVEEVGGGVQPARDLPVDVPVFSRDGEQIGTVTEVVEQAFKSNAPMRPDYWLSTEAIASATPATATRW